MKDWSMAGVWNAALMRQDSRPARARDNLWASELGKAPVDIFLRLKGVEPSNPPNARSMRKFEAGNVFEWIVSLILKRAGILQDSQKWTSYQFPGLLKVTGKADFIAGGKPDFDKAIEEMKSLDMPDVFVRAAEAMKMHFAKEYPDGLITKPLEIKSVSSFMFDSLEKKKTGSKIHRLQCKHYLKAEKYEKGDIVYICRDDLRMMQIPLLNSDEMLEAEYHEFIALMTGYVERDEMPPLEKPIIFDPDMGKLTTNFNVAYSGYLTKLYGLKDQKEFDDKYKGMCGRWNRVINRVKNGDKMTPKNLAVLVEITEAGFDPADLASKFAGEPEPEEGAE